jgi:RNA polymerase sigma-70 factor (ECF subfamily)
MEDHAIIELFWQRSEQAIPAVREKYGRYCTAIARNILPSPEDAEECLSDTWLQAWESIPPQRPVLLGAYLGRITRNLAYNRWKAAAADKRGGGQTAAVLEELAECLPGPESAEEALDKRELEQAIREFFAGLSPEKRAAFAGRYFYGQPVSALAKRLGRRENSTSVMLHRLREQLRAHLIERGYAP